MLRLYELNRLQRAEEIFKLDYDELLQKYKAVEELELLRTREAKLNMKVNWLQSADRQSLEDNNKQVKFYTGLLSFTVLLAMYRECHFSGCAMFDRLLIT